MASFETSCMTSCKLLASPMSCQSPCLSVQKKMSDLWLITSENPHTPPSQDVSHLTADLRLILDQQHCKAFSVVSLFPHFVLTRFSAACCMLFCPLKCILEGFAKVVSGLTPLLIDDNLLFYTMIFVRRIISTLRQVRLNSPS